MALAAVVALLALPAVGSAHSWSYAFYNGGTYGASAFMYSYPLKETHPTTDFTNDDLWVGNTSDSGCTNQANPCFIENGMIIGTFCSAWYWNGSSTTCTGNYEATHPTQFYGGVVPGGSATEHVCGATPSSIWIGTNQPTYYAFPITYYIGNDEWVVDNYIKTVIDGSNSSTFVTCGTLTGQQSHSDWLETGMEVSNASFSAYCSQQNALDYWDGNSWIQNWTGASLLTEGGNIGAPSWIDTYAALGESDSPGCNINQPSAPAPHVRSAVILHGVRHLARIMSPATVRNSAMSDISGFGRAASVRYVLTTRARGNELLNDRMSDETPSFVIEATGKFRAKTSRGRAAEGRAVTLIINAETGAMTDFGIGNATHGLSKLGHVVTVR